MPQESNADVFAWTGTEWAFDYPIRAGGNDQPVNPDLKPSYVDEFNLSLQQQIGNNMAVGVRGIYRKWNDIVDDVKMIDADGVQVPHADQLLERHHRPHVQVDRDHVQPALLEQLPGPRELHAGRRRTGNADRSYSLTAFTSQLLDYPNDTCTVDARRQQAGGLGAVPGDPRPQPRRPAAVGRHQLGQDLRGVHVSRSRS